MVTGISNLDNKDKLLDELCKCEELYRTKQGRYEAMGHIIRKYIRLKGIKCNPKTIESNVAPIVDFVLNDREFRYWTYDNYRVYIQFDEGLEMFFIHKVTEEMLELYNKSSEEDLKSKQIFDGYLQKIL